MGDVRNFETLRNLHTKTQLLLPGPIILCSDTSQAQALPRKLQTLNWNAIEVLTRNGAKDLNTTSENLFSTRRRDAFLETSSTHDGPVEACKKKGIDLILHRYHGGG